MCNLVRGGLVSKHSGPNAPPEPVTQQLVVNLADGADSESVECSSGVQNATPMGQNRINLYPI